MYRLPTVSQGEIRITVAPVTGPQPTGLVKELYHGDALVASSLNYLPIPPRQNLSWSDNSWRLRLQLAKGSRAADAFGSLPGGLALTMGSTPR